MNTNAQKVCFVVMGFGKKTDYGSGRTLDLDATYEAIIKPAAEAENLRCIRADEIMHSGIIDTEMYQMLLLADLVVADISTGNVNAVYELGVRHALRPSSTIIMKEDKGDLYFDLDHTNTFKYEHLGEDIGSREAVRAKNDLQKLITAVLSVSKPDSPVYTFLPTLQQPTLTPKEYETLLDRTEDYHNRLVGHIHAGDKALMESRPGDAVKEFAAAEKIKPQDPYIIQKLALATYKSGQPSPHTALIDGLMIIEMLKPGQSNDPETLGITGAIHKRLWQITADICQLDAAIHFYSRGFEIRQDYYNGENLALCLDHRAKTQTNSNEALYDRMSARKTREIIVNILSEILLSPSFQDRSDKKWIHATFANCSFALGNDNEGNKQEALFRKENPAAWEITSYEDSKSALQSLLCEVVA